jgi:hypothetical protein
MRVVTRLIALASFLLPVTAPAEPLTVSGLTFPDSIADFARGPGRNYEKDNPGLGYSFGYRRAPWTATVYVYDQRRASIPDDLQSDIIRAVFAEATRDILDGARRGVWRKADLVRELNLPAAGRPRFACARFTIVNKESVELDSTLCVTVARNKFVKFRVTGPRQGADPAEPLRFIEAWSRLLWPQA